VALWLPAGLLASECAKIGASVEGRLLDDDFDFRGGSEEYFHRRHARTRRADTPRPVPEHPLHSS
jgi:hypothetical protein